MSVILKLVLVLCCSALPSVIGASQKMIVIGGWSAATWTEATVEIYDFDTKQWTRAADLPHGRRGLGAATVDGIVYGVGGFTLAHVSSTTVAYDPTTNTWSNAADMASIRDCPGVAAFEGKMYSTGGASLTGSLSSVEVFESKAWKAFGRGMGTQRWRHGVAVLSDGFYAVGGIDRGVVSGTILNSAEKMSSTGLWTPIASMSTPRENVRCAVAGGKLYAIGGTNDGTVTLKSVEVYDPISNSWSAAADMNVARQAPGVVSYNGLIYVVGGFNGDYIDSMEVYDPATNTWTMSMASLSVGRAWSGATLM